MGGGLASITSRQRRLAGQGVTGHTTTPAQAAAAVAAATGRLRELCLVRAQTTARGCSSSLGNSRGSWYCPYCGNGGGGGCCASGGGCCNATAAGIACNWAARQAPVLENRQLWQKNGIRPQQRQK